MDTRSIDRLTEAVLYEGYLLYPYRPSLKNAQRWSFGGVYPRSWSETAGENDRWQVSCACIVEGSEDTEIESQGRFLHLIERSQAAGGQQSATAPTTWHEAIERRVEPNVYSIGELTVARRCHSFEFPASTWHEEVSTEGASHDAQPAEQVWRRQEMVQGTIELSARQVAPNARLVEVVVRNDALFEFDSSDDDSGPQARAAAQLRSLVSLHVVLRARGGMFASRIDPPEGLRSALAPEENHGLWPVLVGEQPERSTMLCAPIILYDYPQLAPESAGDYFDATEMDEMLALRVLTLSPDELREVEAWDERGAALLERTRAMAEKQLASLHGAIRSLRSIEEPSDGE